MKLEPNKMGFHWRGRNKQGISKWSGSVVPLKWIGAIFSIYGPIVGVAGICALIYMLLTPHPPSYLYALIAVGLTHGIIFTATGIWALAMRKRILSLSRAEEVSVRLGIDASALNALAEQRNINPRIILNDEPYYDLSEFVGGRG